MSKGPRSKSAPAKDTGSTGEPPVLAADLAQTAKDRTAGIVEQQKAAAADQVEDIARVLDDVAQKAPVGAPFLRQAASGIHRISSSLRDRSVDEIMREFGRFAGRRPAAVIGASLIGGFALARFLKSSADRHSLHQQSPADVQAQPSVRPETAMPTPSPSSMATPDVSTASGGLTEAGLDEIPSRAAGMGPIPDTAPGITSNPIGTSSAGGGAEAPDQGTV